VGDFAFVLFCLLSWAISLVGDFASSSLVGGFCFFFFSRGRFLFFFSRGREKLPQKTSEQIC
jgi:hypothetical protein